MKTSVWEWLTKLKRRVDQCVDDLKIDSELSNLLYQERVLFIGLVTLHHHLILVLDFSDGRWKYLSWELHLYDLSFLVWPSSLASGVGVHSCCHWQVTGFHDISLFDDPNAQSLSNSWIWWSCWSSQNVTDFARSTSFCRSALILSRLPGSLAIGICVHSCCQDRVARA